jgi:hypothetical protein
MQLGAELLQHLGCNTFALAYQTQQDVLGPDVIVAQLERFTQGEFENLLGARSERNMPAGRLRTLPDNLNDLRTHRLQADTEALQTARGHAFTLVDETEEDVLGPYVVMV